MKKRDFSEWLSTFRRSINGYEYYTDFKKVYENAERLKVEICILMFLLQSADLVPLPFINFNRFSSAAGNSPIGQEIRGICKNQIYTLRSHFAQNFKSIIPIKS